MPAIELAELPGRVTLSYAHQGDAAGTPVLLLHGVTDSWRSFEPVLAHLPASLHAVALTQRGHGDSGRPATGYRTRDYAADVAAFVEALGLGPVVVVGHSMGATNAQRFAIEHPELTRGLVLVSSFATYRDNAAVTELWESTVARLTDPVDPGFVREFQESTLARPVAPAFLDMVMRESLKVPARVWRASFEGFLEDDLAGELGRIRAPTLVIWGDRDVLCPRRSQDLLLAEIAGSRLIVYEGAGHAVHWEEPQRFAADVTAFARAAGG
jgi:pimeloyl-ACP methyl ester carboxylesterase